MAAANRRRRTADAMRHRFDDDDDDYEPAANFESFAGNIYGIVGSLVMLMMMYMVWQLFSSPLGSKFGDAMGEFAETAVDILSHWEIFAIAAAVFTVMPYVGQAVAFVVDRTPFSTEGIRKRASDMWNWRNITVTELATIRDARKAFLDLDSNRNRPLLATLPEPNRQRVINAERGYLSQFSFQSMNDNEVLSFNEERRRTHFIDYMNGQNITGLNPDIIEGMFDSVDYQTKIRIEMDLFRLGALDGGVTDARTAFRIDQYLNNTSLQGAAVDSHQGLRQFRSLVERAPWYRRMLGGDSNLRRLAKEHRRSLRANSVSTAPTVGGSRPRLPSASVPSSAPGSSSASISAAFRRGV